MVIVNSKVAKYERVATTIAYEETIPLIAALSLHISSHTALAVMSPVPTPDNATNPVGTTPAPTAADPMQANSASAPRSTAELPTAALELAAKVRRCDTSKGGNVL